MSKNAFKSFFIVSKFNEYNSMFLTKRLAINKRYLDHYSLTKTIVNKLIFVIIKKFIFAKALGAWWNW